MTDQPQKIPNKTQTTHRLQEWTQTTKTWNKVKRRDGRHRKRKGNDKNDNGDSTMTQHLFINQSTQAQHKILPRTTH